MSVHWIRVCAVFCCVAASVTAYEKLEDCHMLSFARETKAKAGKITLSFRNGKDCSHIAKYENGQIVTVLGRLGLSLHSVSINLAGEQTVTLYNEAGQVCFTSLSKEWELQNKVIVHHHDGFDVYTDKKEQCVVVP
jgi:hypothetical protein